MECKIRDWKIEDAPLLAAALNNKNIQNNLRDGLPYPYSESDAKDYISGVLSADKTGTFKWISVCEVMSNVHSLNTIV